MVGTVRSTDDMQNCLSSMKSVTEMILCATVVTSYGPSKHSVFCVVLVLYP